MRYEILVCGAFLRKQLLGSGQAFVKCHYAVDICVYRLEFRSDKHQNNDILGIISSVNAVALREKQNASCKQRH